MTNLKSDINSYAQQWQVSAKISIKNVKQVLGEVFQWMNNGRAAPGTGAWKLANLESDNMMLS